MPLASPEHLNGEEGSMDDICNEQPPPEMTELACEALTEELQQVQVKWYNQSSSHMSSSYKHYKVFFWYLLY